ncbi:hypothetical protein ACIBKY_51115 [Nonomuraea sp. NPDC050394]|uniref:hypothetical protein n=1 Tax=Nonomuraea sp. NPDC050394 TaxID=3364363 RepID=UPI0037A84DCD
MAADPDIEARWADMRAAVRAILAPHIQTALLDRDVTAIADWLNQNGWKPPLTPYHPLLGAGRAARDHAAHQKDPE